VAAAGASRPQVGHLREAADVPAMLASSTVRHCLILLQLSVLTAVRFRVVRLFVQHSGV